MRRRTTALLLALALALTLCACRKRTGIPDAQDGGEDFQKNMAQVNQSWLDTLCATDTGYYIQYAGGSLYYVDKAKKTSTIVCGKPECRHDDDTCNAYLHATGLWFTGNKLYFTNGDLIFVNGTPVDYGERVYSLNPDGTDHQPVQKLEFTPGGDLSYILNVPIYHRGMVYFTYNGMLYRVPLGGDIEDAEKIWGTGMTEDDIKTMNGIPIIDPNALGYTLWADGDFLYFMVNLPQEDGSYKDTLFSCDTDTKKVTEVWAVPDAGEVGEWETTGVSVSRWYVKDGTVYFYLSGGDFWKTDLGAGKTELVAKTSEKTRYGTAVMSDDYLCLLNDRPDFDKYAGAVSVFGMGGKDYIGGDTIYVYGLDGTFVKELPLDKVYDEIDGVTHLDILFCDGNEIYFSADASTWSERVNGASHIISDMILCCVSVDTGEITANICAWS